MTIQEITPKLVKALTKFAEDFNSKEENKGKSIQFREERIAQRPNPANSFVPWGTERMDKLFPKMGESSENPQNYYGHKYIYGFTFVGASTMRTAFWLAAGRRFETNRTKMEKIASEVGERPLDERSPDWIKRFLPDTSLVAITSDEQVQEIVNERIDEIIKWEDEKYERIKEILKGSDNGPGGPPVDYIKIKITLLEKSKNLILTGAPGTGKTYLARQMAMRMITGKTEEKNLTDEEKAKFKNQCRFVQFHPSYDYTDFVEGLRPFGTGQIGFRRQDGIFKAFCKKALENTKEPKEPYVFIIDEINRGEISKIFGELFFSIEPGYRGKKGIVQTQYTNLIADDDVFKEGFYIPENVYIIGTMNDIDRSVESFDFAMRRRFVWEEVTAKDSYINMRLGLEGDYENSRMKKLNDLIQKIPGLNSSYHIGGSYFRNEPNESALWKLRLKPLLREYLRGLDAEKYRDELEKSESIDGFVSSIHTAFGSNDSGGQE